MGKPAIFRKKNHDINPELRARLDSELKILVDIIRAANNGDDCLDPAVLEFQRECHILTKMHYTFLHLEMMQAKKREFVTVPETVEPWFF